MTNRPAVVQRGSFVTRCDKCGRLTPYDALDLVYVPDFDEDFCRYELYCAECVRPPERADWRREGF